MPNRFSTLLREDAMDLGKAYLPPSRSRERAAIVEEVTRVQNEILYDNTPVLYNTCIVCDAKLTGKRSDHFVSAVCERSARFREDHILAIEHPMNMVYCCRNSRCNNEKQKKVRLASHPRLQAYYDYVLANCPTNGTTREEWIEHAKKTEEAENARLVRVKDLLSRSR